MMRCKIEGPSITASHIEVPISTTQSQPVTGLKEESITQQEANFPSKPQEQIVSNSIESKTINSIPLSGEAQPLTLPLNSQDPPLSSSTDTKTIPPSSTTIQKPISKPEIKPSSSELIVQNYEVSIFQTLSALRLLFLLRLHLFVCREFCKCISIIWK